MNSNEIIEALAPAYGANEAHKIVRILVAHQPRQLSWD